MINRKDEDHRTTASAWTSLQRLHAGIIVASQQRYTAGEELRRLMRLIGSLTSEEKQNRIEFLSAWF